MKCRYTMIIVLITLIQILYAKQIMATTLKKITVTNNTEKAMIILDCSIAPIYMIFTLHNPERVVIDFLKIFSVQKNMLPMNFNGDNLIKCVRTSAPIKSQSIRIVLDLSYASSIEAVTQKKIGKNYQLILTVFKKKVSIFSDTCMNTVVINPKKNCVEMNHIVLNNKKNVINIRNNSNINIEKDKKNSSIIVAIDAGHGGQDPGATGCNGIYEKHVNINIANKLKVLLDSDPMFNAVMIRDGDYFLSVMERSDIARKKGANVLISIHADSVLNDHVRGASVWVLSNRRARSEMLYLLQRSEKHSELLGGVGDVLTNYHNNFYFNHFILDLQFGYSQRVGYGIAESVLKQLKGIGFLHKGLPEYSSFGILRAPDIPSILIETGFISNTKEARLLSSNEYQNKIANAVYRGVKKYFINQLKKSSNNYLFIKKNML